MLSMAPAALVEHGAETGPSAAVGFEWGVGNGARGLDPMADGVGVVGVVGED